MADSGNCAKLFTGLGLTQLEAETYVFLLQESPASGYRIAKGIGRSFPSTYKALISLQEKGAILVDEGSSRLCRAVSPEEFLDQIEHRMRRQRDKALAAVRELPRSPRDTRIYQLTSVDQVYERCRQMLRECEERALVELFPGSVSILREPIEETAARGIDITARVYQQEILAGVRMVQSPFGSETLRMLRSEWLAILIDGRQFLLANHLTNNNIVLNAVWSANPTVSRALYDHANSDFHHYAFRPFLEAATSVEELRAEYQRLQNVFPVAGDLGLKDMLGRLVEDSSPEGEAQQ